MSEQQPNQIETSELAGTADDTAQIRPDEESATDAVRRKFAEEQADENERVVREAAERGEWQGGDGQG